MAFATTLRENKQPFVQAKLSIGQPNDKYEQEADAVADQVMRISSNNSAGIQRKCTDCEEEELQMKPSSESITLSIQKQEEDEELQMNGLGNDTASHSGLRSSLQKSKGGGNFLDTSTHQFMSNSIGADFSQVKVHTDNNAIQMNQELNAKAFTNGSDIYFNQGQYNPQSSEGKHLLAHELTHVVQQGGTEQSINMKPEGEEEDGTIMRKSKNSSITISRVSPYIAKSCDPERNGDLWYGTRREAETRRDSLITDGTCTEETCRVSAFPHPTNSGAQAYRVLICTDDSDAGADGNTPSRTASPPEVHINLREPQKVKLFHGRGATIFNPVSAGNDTDPLVRSEPYSLTKREDPLARLGKWGLLYFAPFRGGIGFHSNICYPKRRTLCNNRIGGRRYCTPTSNLENRVRHVLRVDGTRRSHGCIRMTNANARTFFGIVRNGTPVYVYNRRSWHPRRT